MTETRARDPADLNHPALRARASSAARGDTSFDVLITGGRLVNMVTGQIDNCDIGLTGALIASVHPAGSRTDASEIIDAAGAFLSPGLIDTHMHIESSMITPAAYAECVMPRGVTTIVWDPHEFGNVHGLAAVRWAVEATRPLPLRVITLAPSSVPSAPGLECAGADFDAAVIAEILSWPEIGGVAEVMNMRGVIDGDPRMTGIVNAGLASGKIVAGHARGLEGADLNAFMAAGVTSDHELTSGADFLAKLSAGMTIELRGSHDYLLTQFVNEIKNLGHMPQTITLCTDDVFPDELHRDGGLDDVVRRLVRDGLRPEWALRAATLNAAMRLNRPDLGLIAAGRRADIVLFDDLEDFRARLVLADGKPVARNGKALFTAARLDPEPLRHSVKLEPLSEGDFRVLADGDRVRIATIDQPRFTAWGEMTADVAGGFVVPPPGTTLLAIAHRHGRVDDRPRIGFLTGWGEWRGAFCTTVSHDSHNLTVFGGNVRDMTLAANAVIAAGGGMAVASNGRLDAILPLPLSGLVSEAGLEEIAAGFGAIRKAMTRVVDWKPPYLVFKACFGAALACNIGPHQTDRGIADVTTGQLLESPVL
ncbi:MULTISPECIES: adenine deaminase [unclassified Rhizobium]|uniref:adenine deaminase n=1 Tax=unclassified Rhizobium TaxID=2613769 RepID=UPI001ADD4C68|nr:MULTISPECIES: adenine deaminase C-terminal domain-containing protein [unclassified Rhizobium]MBO9096731.1 adenine deaminase [Rhizobium sp. L58/93]MBO9166986.1 adenine deaminase [Rhizobium sp. L245/93]MBO9182958.1 adenine deaminase [Rhizobium sp. E27B/91]QXZ83327.1 adenine deaminase [Rhizobium sp. K1/93]QXZ89161.1 adenine deaminase [Rhizobium sp. K15/93]